MSNIDFNKDQEVRRYFENVFKAYEARSKNVLFMQKKFILYIDHSDSHLFYISDR